ncbi:hypothetical protein [Salinarimonas soli]|uniref:Uncharacterized protein n=1 Tax=Salinarimonas soli TaxID=1638099 RepID=A0A5B2V990_9HYPH|nr:hypothetical protein [Salinarimonas soli]KAA2234952.1 hypothetical protein F0L46_21660 [Salinarimonas soli]
MARIRVNGAVWDTGRRWPDRSREAVGIVGRAALVLAAATGLAVGLAGMGSPVEAARGAAPAAPAAVKDASRLGQPGASAAKPAPAGPLSPEPYGTPHTFAAGGDAGAALRLAGTFQPLVPLGWQEADISGATVADGRTLAWGALRIRLEGLDLPGEDETCRTVDGRREPCRARAATVLELTTRWRTLSCRYRLESAHEAVGTCRIGRADLAERMLRSNLVRRAGETPRVLAANDVSAVD